MGGRVEWEVVEEDGRDIAVDGTESNEFFRLLGVGPLPFRSRFRVDHDGRIVWQRHESEGPGPDYAAALEKAVAWAEQHQPDELAEIYPDGQLVYSEAIGRRWVALLRRWKAA